MARDDHHANPCQYEQWHVPIGDKRYSSGKTAYCDYSNDQSSCATQHKTVFLENKTLCDFGARRKND